MPPGESDRRQAIRRTPHPDEALSHARLRTGRELTVVNISSVGALVEGLTRLLPGTRAEIHLVTRHGRVLVRSRVIRSLVSRLEADIVCYRTGLAFDTTVDTDVRLAQSEQSESNGPALSERSDSKGIDFPQKSQEIVGGRAFTTQTLVARNGFDVGTQAYVRICGVRSRGIDFGSWQAALCGVGGGGGE